MNFLPKLLQRIAFIPTIVNSIEGLFGSIPASKRRSRLSRLSALRCN